MRLLLTVSTGALLLAHAISSTAQDAQESAPKLVPPTDFETFATTPQVHVIFSKQVGSIESSDAKATVTALVLADEQNPPAGMRGVRLDLESNSGHEQVYLDDSQLEKVRREVHLMESGIETFAMKDTTTPYRVTGTESCWMPNPRVRILCPDYYIGPDWSGLRLRPLGSRGFEFPDHKPAELTKLFDAALTELRQR